MKENSKKVLLVVSTVLAIALACLNIAQYVYEQNLLAEAEATIASCEKTISAKEDEIAYLESEQEDTIASYEQTISAQEAEIASLEAEVRSNSSSLSFYETYAVVVPDDGTGMYHVYGCEDLDTSSFWIYNINAAEDMGYYACPKCYH